MYVHTDCYEFSIRVPYIYSPPLRRRRKKAGNSEEKPKFPTHKVGLMLVVGPYMTRVHVVSVMGETAPDFQISSLAASGHLQVSGAIMANFRRGPLFWRFSEAFPTEFVDTAAVAVQGEI